MDLKHSFGAYIRTKRVGLGLTQRQLADLLFVAESTVSKWERGLSYPDVALIPQVCRALNITEHEFFQACDDENAAAQARNAAVGRKVILAWRRFFAVSYAIALVTCFICDLAVFHTLDWFWIVLTSIGLSFCLTNLPFLVRRNRITICLAGATCFLFALLLACWAFVGGYWLGRSLAITAASLALPWGVWVLWRWYGRHMAALSLALLSVWVFFLLAVIQTCTGGAFPLRFAWSIAALSLVFVWAVFALGRWLPADWPLKTALIFSLCTFSIPVINSYCAWLFPGEEAGPSFSAYFSPRSLLALREAGSLDWVNILVFWIAAAVSVVLLVVGLWWEARRRLSSETAPNPPASGPAEGPD